MAEREVPPLWDGESHYTAAFDVERDGYEKTELILWGRRLDRFMPHKGTHEEMGRAFKKFVERAPNLYSQDEYNHTVSMHKSAAHHYEKQWRTLLNDLDRHKRLAARDGIRQVLAWARAFAAGRSGKYRQEGAQELVEAMRRSIGEDTND